MDKLKETISEGIFAGDELEGVEAIAHYRELCSWIVKEAGVACPYLILPMRLQLMHLELAGDFNEALRVAHAYKDLIKKHLYLDEISMIAVDLIIARLHLQLGELTKGKELADAGVKKIQSLINEPSRQQ